MQNPDPFETTCCFPISKFDGSVDMIVGVSKIAAALGRWAMVMETRMADSERRLVESERRIADSDKRLADSDKRLADSEKTNILQKREIDQLRSEMAHLKGLRIL